ncbi:MAG: hypothetical protein ACLPPF_14625 [Rhodomicrobium sp.]
MNTSKRLILAAVGLAISAAPLVADAKGRTDHRPVARRTVHRYAYRPAPLYSNPTSTWRYRSNYGWDNTCFDLPWLSNAAACSSHGR